MQLLTAPACFHAEMVLPTEKEGRESSACYFEPAKNISFLPGDKVTVKANIIVLMSRIFYTRLISPLLLREILPLRPGHAHQRGHR